jgi:decaprenylphospho-beta-D-ribofuranose 2-oxidase
MVENLSKIQLYHFSGASTSESVCYRPDFDFQLENVLHESPLRCLGRGAGLSYSDCCFNSQGAVIDSSRLNHFISFDPATGIVICQGGVSFKDLLNLDDRFIPPIVPGTLHATLAGGIANDVHGKNSQRGGLGEAILWIELLIGAKAYLCSPIENSDLFYATLGGIGLTGFINKVALQLLPASQTIEQTILSYHSLEKLIDAMQTVGMQQDYQAAWVDLINLNRAILFLGKHNSQAVAPYTKKDRKLPTLPFRIIQPRLQGLLNKVYFRLPRRQLSYLPFSVFNNPLDQIKNWNGMYGPRGLLQFQGNFPQIDAKLHMHTICNILKKNKAYPILSVLKYFTRSGKGMLSFVSPGFTLAVDFVNSPQARQTIGDLNSYMTEISGKVYLAKDMLLTPHQFRSLYPKYHDFEEVLHKYKIPIHSDMATRLEIKTYGS